VSASQAILLGDCDVAIGGGAENMSRGPTASLNMRWGARMGDTKMVDMMIGALHDPFHTIHMGVTAENMAAKWGITREDAGRAGRGKPQPRRSAPSQPATSRTRSSRHLTRKKGDVLRHRRALPPRRHAGRLAKLKPVFKKENGTVTAGNASGINDAAAPWC
jgi:acetyl-CoA C-acetyltransferase